MLFLFFLFSLYFLSYSFVTPWTVACRLLCQCYYLLLTYSYFSILFLRQFLWVYSVPHNSPPSALKHSLPSYWDYWHLTALSLCLKRVILPQFMPPFQGQTQAWFHRQVKPGPLQQTVRPLQRTHAPGRPQAWLRGLRCAAFGTTSPSARSASSTSLTGAQLRELPRYLLLADLPFSICPRQNNCYQTDSTAPGLPWWLSW